MKNEVMVKPEFNEDIIVNIPEIPEVTHNLQKLKDFTLKLVEYYEKTIIDIDELTKERTKINKFLKQVSDIRKANVEKYKKPINDFEKTSKEVELLLKETSDKMTTLLNLEKDKQKLEKTNRVIQPYIDKKVSELFVKGYLIDKTKLIFDDKWFNKTTTDKSIFEDIDAQLDDLVNAIIQERKDIAIINTTMETLNIENKELYIQQYNFTKDLQSVISKMQSDVKIKEQETKIKQKLEEPLKLESIYEVRFAGTKEECDKLRSYAKMLGMEER